MENAVWDKIVSYDLDSPMSEYGFSTRLANENYWTKNFTAKAIVEYKKFMYLAATSDMMVSPSEIIDIVWHQHLIFTQSYKEFCELLGKQIQHVPSTHNKEDFDKFKQAKERTIKLYKNTFGDQPRDIWQFSGMYESLQLEKAKYKIRSFIIIGLLILIPLSIPAYLLLQPIYLQIDGADFIYQFAIISILLFIVLRTYNELQFRNILSRADKSSFVFELSPGEMIYMKSGSLPRVIDGTLNQLLLEKKITVDSQGRITCVTEEAPTTLEEYQVFEEMRGQELYSTLVRKLENRPVFSNIRNHYDALMKYIVKSKKFAQLFYTNFAVLALLLLLGFVRLGMGIVRDKPVTLISIVLVLITIASIVFLFRLTTGLSRILVRRYTGDARKVKNINGFNEWQYFLMGSAVLVPALTSISSRRDLSNNDSGSSSGCSSSGSSCGSSCSSCGGCGGD